MNSNPSSKAADAAPDYSRKDCWYQIPNITRDVDTFFIYPTDYMASNEGDPDYAPLDNPEMLEGAKFDHMVMASAYEDSTNLFMPYYRQAGMRYAGEVGKKSGDPRTAFAATPYDDVTAALDYYFENYNNGRPFIIAGHSQGSGIITLVLMKYFREHPEYYERMIAAYVIGFSVTKDDLDANPHLKFAAGERDTGVIVSWNTEGRKNVEENASNVAVLPNAISINPLNWKLDETYAPASANLGSLVLNEKTNTLEIADIGADAQVIPGRGVILTNADYAPIEGAEFFGPQSFHNGDYTLFYNNIKDNVAKRVAAYKSKKGENVMEPHEIREQLRAMYGGENKPITDRDYDSSLAVKCINGTFVGRKTENITIFRGIPYVGRQPAGKLRWKAPVDVVPDDGVYQAYYNAKSAYGNAELETGSYYYLDEDCLYLNVWKSDEAPAQKKPVMVWIHGGAFEAGGTIDPMFDCFSFVKENPDVIVVTIAYRLGALGFLHLSHLPDGRDYPDSQNLGLLDQVKALKWVHENIAGFGGDPDNVTIFGESAGAASCTLLPLIPDSRQYFKRLIAESGSVNQTRSPEEGIAHANKLMGVLGCTTVADLMKVDGEKLLEASSVLFAHQMPERDGKYLPADTFAAYAGGAAKDLEILVGCNKDEMDFFVSSFGLEGWDKWIAERKKEKFACLPANEKALVESYMKDVKGDWYEPDSRVFSQSWFIAPVIRLSEEQTRGGGKCYTYYLTPESPDPIMKCGHAIELSIVFNHPEMTADTGRAFDETFCRTMRKMWVQFAKTGDPSLSADISPDGKAKEWPLYDLENKQVMVLDEFDIHPAKESEVKIVDWDRTYFLTKYYML